MCVCDTSRFLYVLESFDGEPIGNLNALRVAKGFVGLEALSINPLLRGRGYGSMLMRAVMELVRCEDPKVCFILYSEGATAMYEKLGFRPLDDKHQFRRPSVGLTARDEALVERTILLLRDSF